MNDREKLIAYIAKCKSISCLCDLEEGTLCDFHHHEMQHALTGKWPEMLAGTGRFPFCVHGRWTNLPCPRCDEAFAKLSPAAQSRVLGGGIALGEI
jgi:hypothetical protein